MANKILTAQIIAREALIRLKSNMVMPGLVYRDYSSDFKKVGESVDVRKPATFVADEFGGSINLQEIGESSVSIKMDILADVSTEVTSTEMALDIDEFGPRILDGMILAISEKIDSKIAQKAALEIPYFSGVSGTTPNSIKTGFGDPRLLMNKARVPQAMRRIVFGPDAEAELGNIDSFNKVNENGNSDALREAVLGRLKGFDTYMDQNIVTHTAGGFTALTDVTITAGAADADTISLTSAAGSSTDKLLAGDLMTIDGHQYVVTEDTADAVSGVIAAVKIYPKLHKVFSGMTSKNATFADQSARAHVSNLAFHKNAIALVNAPLLAPQGASQAYTAVDPVSGLSIRVVWGYDQKAKKEMLSVDCLFGVKTIFPELACQILG